MSGNCREVSSLYKTVMQKVYGRKGITSIKLADNQILVYLVGEVNPHEISHIAEIDVIVDSLPMTSKLQATRTGQ